MPWGVRGHACAILHLPNPPCVQLSCHALQSHAPYTPHQTVRLLGSHLKISEEGNGQCRNTPTRTRLKRLHAHSRTVNRHRGSVIPNWPYMLTSIQHPMCATYSRTSPPYSPTCSCVPSLPCLLFMCAIPTPSPACVWLRCIVCESDLSARHQPNLLCTRFLCV